MLTREPWLILQKQVKIRAQIYGQTLLGNTNYRFSLGKIVNKQTTTTRVARR